MPRISKEKEYQIVEATFKQFLEDTMELSKEEINDLVFTDKSVGEVNCHIPLLVDELNSAKINVLFVFSCPFNILRVYYSLGHNDNFEEVMYDINEYNTLNNSGVKCFYERESGTVLLSEEKDLNSYRDLSIELYMILERFHNAEHLEILQPVMSTLEYIDDVPEFSA